MTAPTYTPVRPCKKCGTAERHASGHCKACKRANGRAGFANGPRSVSPSVPFLAALPGDRHHIMAITGLCESAVRIWQKRLREEGKAHIGSYQRCVGRPNPTYVAGPGVDATPPDLLTPKRPSAKKPKKRVRVRKVTPKPVVVKAPVPVIRVPMVRPLPVPTSHGLAVVLAHTRAAFPLGAVWG
jgi:hypothetical protein